jgi:hypothetical protein
MIIYILLSHIDNVPEIIPIPIHQRIANLPPKFGSNIFGNLLLRDVYMDSTINIYRILVDV